VLIVPKIFKKLKTGDDIASKMAVANTAGLKIDSKNYIRYP